MGTRGISHPRLGVISGGASILAALGALAAQDLQHAPILHTVLLGSAVVLAGFSVGAQVTISRQYREEVDQLARHLQAVTAGASPPDAAPAPQLLSLLAERIGQTDHLLATQSGQCRQLQALVTHAAGTLSRTGRDIEETARQLADSVGQLASSAQELARGVTSGADRMAAMDASATMASANLQQAAASSAIAAQLTSQGQETLMSAVEKLGTFQGVIGETATATQRLGELSEQIGGIVDIIKRIADQTNLLALNAAIEAARAGEHGRGFAVVADEVRHLSNETTSSIKQIHGMISEIQQETRRAVEATRHGTREAGDTASLIEDATNSMLMIAEAIADSDQKVSAIAVAIGTLASDISDVSHEVSHLAAAAEQTAAATEQISAATDAQSRSAVVIRDIAARMQELGQTGERHRLTEPLAGPLLRS